MGKALATDHLQIATPRGEAAAARTFYRRLPGLAVLPKPEALAARGASGSNAALIECTSAWMMTSALLGRHTRHSLLAISRRSPKNFRPRAIELLLVRRRFKEAEGPSRRILFGNRVGLTRQAGYAHAVNLKSDIEDWRAASLPPRRPIFVLSHSWYQIPIPLQ